MRNELKELVERLKDAKKTELQTQGDSEETGRRTRRESHRTRTQCFCRND